MNKSFFSALGSLLFVILFSYTTPADAAQVHFFASLSQAWNEVFGLFPPEGTGSAATGTLTFDYDTSKNLVFNINLSVQGLSVADLPIDTTHRTHIHRPFGTEIMVDIGSKGLVDVAGGFGSIDGGSAVISDLFETELLSGQSWVNVHTKGKLLGEIAGVVTPVPVPSSLLLLVSGIFGSLGLSFLHRKK